VTRDPHAVTLPADHTWWRVADTAWADPLDPTWADRTGGRWNAPGDGPTLYLNADVETARAQVPRMLLGTAVDPEDLRDDAPFVLVPVALPARQRVADATTDTGLVALGLPRGYPRRTRGGEVPWSACRRAARTTSRRQRRRTAWWGTTTERRCWNARWSVRASASSSHASSRGTVRNAICSAARLSA